jgi:hypothetical protein
MDRILARLDFVQCYINDIMVYSDIVKEHQSHLQIVFEPLKAHGLHLHLGKCGVFGSCDLPRWFKSATSQGGGYCMNFTSHGCE